VASVDDQYPVEALAVDGADESFSERVGFRRLHGRSDDVDAFALEDGVEGSRELRVAVADHKPDWRVAIIRERLDAVAGPLGCPGAGRVGGDASNIGLASREVDEDEGSGTPQARRPLRTGEQRIHRPGELRDDGEASAPRTGGSLGVS
jgi:hypothetical protein